MAKNGALSASILDKNILKEHGVGALNPILSSQFPPMENTVMGLKKQPFDVAKFHFNTKDWLIVSVLPLIIQVRGVILMTTILKHGAIARIKVETMWKFCSGIWHFCISAILNIHWKPYLFARLNPITAIENCTIKNRKMVIVCQQMIQLIIALIWFWQPKRQKNNKDHIYYQPHQIVLSLFSSTDLLHKNINRRQILRFCHKYCIVEY